MAAGLRGAFAGVAAQPIPERLERAVQGNPAQIVDFAQARSARESRRTQPLWVQLGALAATLAVGVFAGNLMTGSLADAGAPSSIQAEAGRLVAAADLENALYARLASAPADSGPRIGLTFRDKSGSICRTFEARSASGLACREDGDWRIRSVFQAPEGQTTDYRMASGANPRLLEEVDAAIAGEPFDAAQEKAAMARGWR